MENGKGDGERGVGEMKGVKDDRRKDGVQNEIKEGEMKNWKEPQ